MEDLLFFYNKDLRNLKSFNGKSSHKKKWLTHKISKSISFQVGADANQTIGIDLALKAGDKKVGFSVAGIAKSLGLTAKVAAAATDADDIKRETGFIVNPEIRTIATKLN